MGPTVLLVQAAAVVAAPVPADIVASIAEVRVKAVAGDTIWPGFSTAPFGFLLVRQSGETLICDSRTPDGFAKAAALPGLDCPVATGPSTWRQPSLLAAMPIFGPGEIIVMGTPESTGLAPAQWRRTILHEHFHQWQGALPASQHRIDALDLKHGDETGMWMLNFSFPYGGPKAGAAHRVAADALLKALAAPDRDVRRAAARYLVARSAFERSVTPEQWRYWDFQLWKEGVARWTEIAVARRSGADWKTDADQAWAGVLDDLRAGRLAKQERVAVYAFGAAEAALLERVRPGWRRDCYRSTVRLGDCWKPRGSKSR